MQRTVASDILRSAAASAARRITLHLQLPGLVITPWIFTAQHSICSVQHLQQWGAPLKGCVPSVLQKCCITRPAPFAA
jgi:hypothetical protein